MIAASRLGLNRIARPHASLAEFFEIAASIGVQNIELRNDLPGRDPVDGLAPNEVRSLASAGGVRIEALNAVQQFDLYNVVDAVSGSVAELVALAGRIGCRAVVLCPNNGAGDGRTDAQIFNDIVGFLNEFGPRFADAGVQGLIEPLGFDGSSLRRKAIAADAIEESGRKCFGIVHDTFHHFLATDRVEADPVPAGVLGLVHLSGVEKTRETSEYTDDDRGLISENDCVGNRRQLELLHERGYSGVCSFEPFSPAVQEMDDSHFRAVMSRSLRRLGITTE